MWISISVYYTHVNSASKGHVLLMCVQNHFLHIRQTLVFHKLIKFVDELKEEKHFESETEHISVFAANDITA